VDNNPLKYIDPTGHVKVIPADICVAVAFLLHLDFVFTCNDGSTTIGVVVFITEGLGFVIQL
jgi:hypothetical protein